MVSIAASIQSFAKYREGIQPHILLILDHLLGTSRVTAPLLDQRSTDRLFKVNTGFISFPQIQISSREVVLKRALPDWLRLWFQSALISEVYPQIRAIAVAYSETNELTVRYYLDRSPSDFDYESLSMVVSAVLSNTSSGSEIVAVAEECIYSDQRMSDIDRLDGLVFARREYEIQDNPSQAPNYI